MHDVTTKKWYKFICAGRFVLPLAAQVKSEDS